MGLGALLLILPVGYGYLKGMSMISGVSMLGVYLSTIAAIGVTSLCYLLGLFLAMLGEK